MTHFAYIVAAYGLVGIVVAVLIIWVWQDRRAQMRALAQLDARRLPSAKGQTPAKSKSS